MRVFGRIFVKEFLQLFRDRKMIPAMIVGPLVQMLALGFAANSDVNLIPTVLVDQDRTAESRGLADRLTGSGYFRIVGVEDTAARVAPWLVDGRAQIALVIGTGYGRAVAGGGTGQVQVIADGTDSNSAVVGLGYAGRILGEAGAEVIASRFDIARARLSAQGVALESPGSVDLRPRVWYNPDLESRWFYVPAILAMVLMLVTMIMPSMAVVREKEIGTLEQLIVTPIRPWQLIAGKLAPFFLIGMIDMVAVSAAVVFLFRVPLNGSFWLLFGITAIFLPTTLGLGLLVSTMVRTQQQAMMSATFLIMVPMIYLSGLIFPIENMPRLIQYATYAIPIRYYNNVIRGIFLKGSGLDVLWRETAVLAGFGIVVVTAAALRFRKTLD